ncbi:MAG: helix-turn-helix domain-containing protein [Lachnospiraceae bacterium]|nr:helix-turn-helix domain-containing protein [Lachnospiraceae bacterium]
MLNEYCFGDIYIRHAIDDFPDDKDFSMHIHDCCEIYFFVSGEVDYLVEGSKYRLDNNNLMIMRPAESHKAKILGKKRYERYAINFPVSFVHSIDPQGRLLHPFTERALGKNNFYNAKDIDTGLLSRLLYEMCYDSNDTYNRNLTITTHLWIILDMINRAFSMKGNAEYQPQSNVEQIVMYVNNHLFEELSVPALAEYFYLSTSQFSRVFKQATGAAPWDYIIKKRLTAAKEKIRSGFSAQEACETSGFKEYSAFYRAYMKHFGCSPKKDGEKIEML